MDIFGNIVKDQSSHLKKKSVTIWTQLVVEAARENGRKTHLSHKSCAFRRLNSRTQLRLEFNLNILVRIYFFLKNYVTSEKAVHHNVLYYQQLHCSLPSQFLC